MGHNKRLLALLDPLPAVPSLLQLECHLVLVEQHNHRQAQWSFPVETLHANANWRTPAHLDPQDPLDLLAWLVCLEFLEKMESPDRMLLTSRTPQQKDASIVHKAHQEHQDLLENPESAVCVDKKELQEPQGETACPDLEANKDHKDHPAKTESLVSLEIKAKTPNTPSAGAGQEDHPANLAQKDPRVTQAYLDHLERLDLLGHLDLPDSRDHLVLTVRKVLKEGLENLARTLNTALALTVLVKSLVRELEVHPRLVIAALAYKQKKHKCKLIM